MWPYVDELFDADDARAARWWPTASPSTRRRCGPAGTATSTGVLAEATLTRPERPAHAARRRPARHPHRGPGLPAGRDAAPAPRPPGGDVVSTAVLPVDDAGARWPVSVPDPEIPVLTIDDLGILRDVAVDDDGTVTVDHHPDLLRLPGDGRDPAATSRTALRGRRRSTRSRCARCSSPAWTTDWITEAGRQALRRTASRRPARRPTGGRPGARLTLVGALPAVRRGDTRGAQPVRLHRLQGAVALPCLPRAVRPLQGDLSGDHRRDCDDGRRRHRPAARHLPPAARRGRRAAHRRRGGGHLRRCPPELRDEFAFAPGQHLTLRTVVDGEEVRRTYSICAPAAEPARLRIGVKRLDRRRLLRPRASTLQVGRRASR